MGRIVVTEFISLDGVVQAPGGEDFKYPNWAFEFDRGEEGERFKVDEALGAAALLLGRATYEGFAAAWPTYEGELAVDLLLQRGHLLDGELQVAGSIRLAQTLIAADLVDEIHLMTYPVVLGTGRRLFGETPDKTTWKLTGSRIVGEGIPITLFERAGR